MSDQWDEKVDVNTVMRPYTFYGKQSLTHTARQQKYDSMERWAFCLGAVLGVPWSTVATYAALGDMIDGQTTRNTERLVASLNRAPGDFTLFVTSPWYAQNWTADEMKASYPAALAVDGHFVVALAVGKSPGLPDLLRYWDPADSLIRTVDLNAFVAEAHPAFGVARRPR